MTHETPSEAFLRVRTEQHDKWEYLAILLGITAGGCHNSVIYRKRVPPRWFPALPAAYLEPVITALIYQHEEAIMELAEMLKKVKPRKGEQPGLRVERANMGGFADAE